MLDIAFHIAVLAVVASAIGLFAFHHSFYDYLLGNMKGAIKERIITVSENQDATGISKQPARIVERKESDIEKALKENLDEPVGSGTSSGMK